MKKTWKLSEQDRLDIIEMYKTGDYTCKKISEIYGVSDCNIGSLLKRRGIKVDNTLGRFKRKYTLNEHYFNAIDTEIKAYFLGLLYADGCNADEAKQVKISLQARDKKILEKFAEEINFNGPLAFQENSKKNENWQDSYILCITSKDMCDSLTKLGCWSRKTLTLMFPTDEQVPTHLVRHFIRGYFDGDGYFGTYLQKKWKQFEASIVSTENFCNSIKNIIEKELQINCYLGRRHKDRDTTTRHIKINGKNKVLKFLDWLYTDASIYLERKHNKYILEKAI